MCVNALSGTAPPFTAVTAAGFADPDVVRGSRPRRPDRRRGSTSSRCRKNSRNLTPSPPNPSARRYHAIPRDAAETMASFPESRGTGSTACRASRSAAARSRHRASRRSSAAKSPCRDAVCRSITSRCASPPVCWSVATSRSSGSCFSFVDKPRRPHVQFIRVRVFQRVLILRAADAVLHRQILHRLHDTA